jgi:U32 family peptidase
MADRLPTFRETPELLAPAGDWDCLRAAVANGADAVYFGLPRFNARLRAHNFTEAELPEVVAFCHRHGAKAYVAFNTLVFTSELDDAETYLRILNRAGVDALIVQDVGLVRLAREIVPELPIHASTQMTVTSPEGAAFASELGVERVVLARELSLRELEKFRATEPDAMPLEVFVHGALCVAYSGQCLTSESLGQRSANRGECAQACRMPYELIVDGVLRDLGDKRYLLSPQDLAAVEQIPDLLTRGVMSFKIEGRLKAPEYVAAVCQVYRRALDAALANREHTVQPDERYRLEMTFSRGLFTGWMHGVDHQQLVPARSGKKRGPFVGRIEKVGTDFVEVRSKVPLKAGDGVVFDTGGDTNAEQGGRLWQVNGNRLFFETGRINFSKLQRGDRIWKTDDPELDKQLRQSFTGRIEPRHREVITLAVRGQSGTPLTVEAIRANGTRPSVISAMPLQPARTAPLGEEKLREHLGRFGEHPYSLGELRNELVGEVILPISELNRLRRELAFALDAAGQRQRTESSRHWREVFGEQRHTAFTTADLQLSVLCRSEESLDAALAERVQTIYVDFEDIRRYSDAVARVRDSKTGAQVVLATPRIQKAGEQGFFRLIENAKPDGVLIRNLGAIDYFAHHTGLPRIGDFSLNVANPLTAQYLISKGLEHVTISYDLTAEQVLNLLNVAEPEWFELTIHQHMPMFHMEHCVFAAFLSKGSSFLDCGRPCDRHRVHLRDRIGMEHPLRADVGCRNTLFNAVPQTGAGYFASFVGAGLRRFRVELLEEDRSESQKVLRAYQALLKGDQGGADLWRALKAQSQLGVTRGTLSD